MANPAASETVAQSSDTVRMALALAECGFAVLPVNRNKRPDVALVPLGRLDATTDADAIERWFTSHPYALVAMRLDPALMAIDIDRHDGKPDGAVSFKRLCERLGDLAQTPAQVSVSGTGRHYIVKAPECDIRKVIEGYPSVDFLSKAYVVIGQWLPGRSPWNVDVAELPSSWLEFIRKERKPEHTGLRDAVTIDADDDDDIYRTIPPTEYVWDLAELTPNSHGFVSCPHREHLDAHPSLKVYDTAEKGWCCHSHPGGRRGGSIYDFKALCDGLPAHWGETADAPDVFDAVELIYERLYPSVV